MRYILVLFAFIYCSGLSAAGATVTACASATVTETTMPQLIHGFSEECIELSSDVGPNEDGSFETHSESQTLEFVYGGCATLGLDTAYTIEHKWRFSITTLAGSGETATAYVMYDLTPKRFTSGHGEFVQTVSGVVASTLCEDGSLNLSAGYKISTGQDSSSFISHEDFDGLYYDPDNPGHGFDFNADDQGLTIFYYGHTASGDRLWLVSEVITGELEYGHPFDLLMYEVTDGIFGQPEFPPSEWGRILITLSDCDNGHADFNGKDGQLAMTLVRLAGSKSSSCL